MNGLAFLHPEAAWAVPALAVVVICWRVFRRPRCAAIGITPLLGRREHRASLLRRAPWAVAAAALVAIVVALMDPVVPYAEERIESTGVDIALVLDLSMSMQEAMSARVPIPGRPSRLEVTKKALSDFIALRRDDRMGLVVFSDNAYVLSPLTLDHVALQRHVSMIDGTTLSGEGMTAIGEGVALGSALLTRQATSGQPRERIILVLTDGENTAGREPVGAVLMASDAGNQIYLVGVDLPDDVKSKPQVRQLIRTVENRGGRYFTADSAAELTETARAVDTLEKGLLVSTRYVQNVPAFAWFAGTAALLTCAALLLRAVPYFVDLT
jgi:Ca-activated chloride channel family protein